MSNRTGQTLVDLNLRAGAGTNFAVLTVLPPNTPVEVVDEQGDWLRVRALNLDGFVHRSFVQLSTQGVPDGLLSTRPSGGEQANALADAPLAPAEDQKIMVGPQASGGDKLLANTWNKYGGLLAALSAELRLDPAVAVAVLAVEAGGRGFGADGRLLIRFENHLFFNQWGKNHAEVFNRFFSFNPDKRWTEHRWRPATNQPWREFHGRQETEWQVFDFARELDDTAAKLSISMGAPQIVGFNYPTLGFESVQQMFDAFSASERNQLIGFFDFIQGPGPNSRRVLALQALDFANFAALYNGPGQAARYASLIQSQYEGFKRLKPA